MRFTVPCTLPRCQVFLEVGQQTSHPRFVARISADSQEGAVVLERLGDTLLPEGQKIGEREVDTSVTRLEPRSLGELFSRLGLILLTQGYQAEGEVSLARGRYECDRLLRRRSRFLDTPGGQQDAGKRGLREGPVPRPRRFLGDLPELPRSGAAPGRQAGVMSPDLRADASGVLAMRRSVSLDGVRPVALAHEGPPDLAKGLGVLGVELVGALQLLKCGPAVVSRKQRHGVDSMCLSVSWREFQGLAQSGIRFPVFPKVVVDQTEVLLHHRQMGTLGLPTFELRQRLGIFAQLQVGSSEGVTGLPMGAVVHHRPLQWL